MSPLGRDDRRSMGSDFTAQHYEGFYISTGEGDGVIGRLLMKTAIVGYVRSYGTLPFRTRPTLG